MKELELVQRMWTPVWIKEPFLRAVKNVLFVAAWFIALSLCANMTVSSYGKAEGTKESCATIPAPEITGGLSGALDDLARKAEAYVAPEALLFSENAAGGSLTQPAGAGKKIHAENPSVSAVPEMSVIPETPVAPETSPVPEAPTLPEEALPPVNESVAATVTITIHGNGGMIDRQEVKCETDTFSVDLLDTPRRLGKVFDGWYEDADCTIPFTGLDAGKEEMDLYAGWSEFPGFICNDQGYITGCTGSREAVSDGVLLIPNHEDCRGIAAGAFDAVSDEVFEICIFPNIVYIEPGAMSELHNLVYVEVLPGNPVYYSEEGIVYHNDGSVAVYPAGRL